MKFLLAFMTSCVALKIHSQNQPYNLFTIDNYNQSIDEIKYFTTNNINNLNINHNINMYSLFTQSYFERCHNYNDPNCNYDLDDQEKACKIYMNDNHNNPDISHKLYYYGAYNDQIDSYLIDNEGLSYKINTIDRIYDTHGVYVIENLNSDEYNMCSLDKNDAYTYISEPDDFHRQMMLYLIITGNKTIACPYWILKH